MLISNLMRALRTTISKLITYLLLNHNLKENWWYIKRYSIIVKLVKLEEAIYVPQFIKDMFPYHNHYVVLCSFMTYHTHMTSSVSYHRVCSNSNTTGVTIRGETAYPSGTPDLTVFFASCCVDRYISIWSFQLISVLSESNYPRVIFKHFFLLVA